MTVPKTYDLVVGLGASGVSMARFLKSLGHEVVATDIDPSRTAEAEALKALGIYTQIGSHDQDVFDKAMVIVPSPGIPLTVSYIKNAAANGVPVKGELDIFTHYNTTPVVAVTGTNGKTTTTQLIAEMLEASGHTCFIGGNIGTPLVEYLMEGRPADLVVAEVSSFQLDLAKEFKPNVAALLNISQDHLDRYPDFDAYADSKWSAFKNQTSEDTAVVNNNIQNFLIRAQKIDATLLEFSSTKKINSGAKVDLDKISINTDLVQDTIETKDLAAMPGNHNRENIAAAVLAVLAAGGTMEGIRQALAGFTPPDHRMAFVRELDGVKFYNDSKATNVDAVLRALESFEEKIILILGGREKGTDFTPLIPAVAANVKTIMAIGEATDHIVEVFSSSCPITPCESMSYAVSSAFEAAMPSDIVILSPACASFDMYTNYEERGQNFTALVKELTPKKEAAHE